MEEQLEQLQNQVAQLQRKVDDLYSDTGFPSLIQQNLEKRGFLRYNGTEVITYTNPSGKDFYSIFVNYKDQESTLSIEKRGIFLPIKSVDTSTDTITIKNHGLIDDQELTIATTDTPPSPLIVQDFYYVINATTDTFKLSTTVGGTAVNLTTIGTGKNYIRIV